MSYSSSITNIFVTCPPGLEDLLAKELTSLGLKALSHGYGGVFVKKEMRAIYRINYGSRLATRVLLPLANFPCADRQALYEYACKIDWLSYMSLDKTFAIDANVSHPALKHSLYAAQVVKDAICDTFRNKKGARPSVSLTSPDVQLNLFIQNGRATISLDTSGTPLFKRGWRKHSAQAPLQESLAATILLLAGYSVQEILCDPFCGSGTLLVEAALMATNTPPGFFRTHWGFFHLPNFSSQEWEEEKRELQSRRIPLEKGRIFGSDKDPVVISKCRENLEQVGFAGQIELETKDIRSYFPSSRPTLITCNPPYGKRLQSSIDAYSALGEFLRSRCAPSRRAFFVCPSTEEAHATKLHAKERSSFLNGGLPVTLFSV